jgi:hypothetical protein
MQAELAAGRVDAVPRAGGLSYALEESCRTFSTNHTASVQLY